ncbi:MAG: hypothetical protein V1848_03530 [Candidatus Magasanikbacteria bacterium]
MFGSKKQSPLEENTPKKINADISVIPGDFYGGQDPVIYNVQAENGKPSVTSVVSFKEEKKNEIPKQGLEEKKQISGISMEEGNKIQKQGAPVPQKKGGFPWVFTIVGFVLVVALISFYYYWTDYRGKAPAQVIQEPPVSEEVNIPEVVIPETPTTTEEIVEETEEVALPGKKLAFPTIFYVNTVDTDQDAMTDLEEALFQTDTGVYDTDGDDYFDGQEMRNLYNPAGFAPVKIIDSGLVKEYTSTVYGYKTYYPTVWNFGEVDISGQQVLFSASTGEYIEIQSFTKLATQSFEDWFAENIEGEKFSELREIVNRFGVNGMKRTDDLVAYYVTPTNVFVLVYQPGIVTEIGYRHIFEMMIQSFRPRGTMSEIAEQTAIPQVPEVPEVPTEETVVEVGVEEEIPVEEALIIE